MATGQGPRKRPGANEPRDPYAHEGGGTRADGVSEALARARRHGRAAASEGLAMLQALIDATALVAGGRPSEASRVFGPIAKLLEGLADDFARGTAGGSSELLATFAAAIDAEIVHWEQRARDDTDARTVLRAFLGLREVLWEFGIRQEAAPAESAPTKRRPVSTRARSSAAGRAPRVQRVPVQG